MAMDNDDVVSTLNDLIETCEDGIKGFRTASENIKRSDAKTVFTTRVQLIERAEDELRSEVRRFGGKPEDSGTTSGAMHRGWLNLKSAITGKDDDAIIAECVRGEDAAVERYEDALKKDLPPDVRVVVERQYRGTLQNRDRVRELKSGAAPAYRAREADREAPPPA